jgi:hypothetical protein
MRRVFAFSVSALVLAAIATFAAPSALADGCGHGCGAPCAAPCAAPCPAPCPPQPCCPPVATQPYSYPGYFTWTPSYPGNSCYANGGYGYGYAARRSYGRGPFGLF